MKRSVRAAGVKQDDTHSPAVRSTRLKVSAEKAGRAHSSWSTSETISGATFFTLTVLLVHVGVADRKYVRRCQQAALKEMFTPWHFNVWRKFTFFRFDTGEQRQSKVKSFLYS